MPCRSEFWLPEGGPKLFPPCILHRVQPLTAGAWQGEHFRVFARHRGACDNCRGCMGLSPGNVDLIAYERLAAVRNLNVAGRGRRWLAEPVKGLQGRPRIRLGLHRQPKVTVHRLGIGSQIRSRAGSARKGRHPASPPGRPAFSARPPGRRPDQAQGPSPVEIASSGRGLIAQGLNGELPSRQGMESARRSMSSRSAMDR